MHRRHISTSSKAADSIAGILSCYQTLRDTRGNHRNVFWDAKEASTKGRGILKKKQTNKKSKRKLKRTVSAQVGVGRVVWWWGEQWPVTFRELDQCLPMTEGKASALQVRGVELTPPPPIQLWDTGNSKNPLPKETKEDWDRDYHKVSQERHISISITLQDISGLWQNHHKATKRPEISLKGQSKHREKILIQPQHWDYQTRNLKYDHHTKLGLERRNKQHARNMETLEGI